MTEPPLDPGLYRETVRRALAEDLGWGDATTLAVVPADARATGVFIARADMILAGLEVALEAFRQLDPAVAVEAWRSDGDRCRAADSIAAVTGLAAPMLTAERTALNFLRHLSGVASATRRLADAAGGAVRIAGTRSTLPLLRVLQQYAVRVGGGLGGRASLDEAMVVTANHARAAGGVGMAVARARSAAGGRPIQAAVTTAAAAEEAVSAGADVLVYVGTLEDELDRLVSLCAGRVRLTATGRLPAERAATAAGAQAAVSAVLVESITDSAPAADISFELRTS
ncbi:MAG TPA: hypothetical protein PLE61_14140 [Vicinamibacterales bacterium]|nr:hypothetical protein [Vicinamibacterales bacterium]HPW21941.1 hypothetical protein [Vicinamibacterales bacterium]